MQLSKVARYTLNHQKFNSKIIDIFPDPPNPYLAEFDMFNKKHLEFWKIHRSPAIIWNLIILN